MVATALTLTITLRDIGLLLSRITVSGQSFGPSVFTGLHLTFWDVGEVRDAVGHDATAGVWEKAGDVAVTLLRVHVAVDLAFALAMSLVFAWLLSAVSGVRGAGLAAPEHRWIGRLPFCYLLVDWTATVAAWVGMSVGFPVFGDSDLHVSSLWAGTIRLLGTGTWVLALANVAAVALLFFRPSIEGTVSWSSFVRTTRRRGHDVEVPTGPPGGVVAVVAFFVVLVALPGGGPLDQFPDVLRVQFEHLRDFLSAPRSNAGDVVEPLVSAGTLLLFTTLVLAVVHASLTPSSPRDIPHGALVVIGGAAALSAALAATRWAVEGQPPWQVEALPAYASLVVVLLLAGIAFFASKVRTLTVDGHSALAAQSPTGQPAAETAGPTSPGQGSGFAALVVTAVVFAASIGGIRALLPVVLVRDTGEWAFAALVLAMAYVTATAGSAVVMHQSRVQPRWLFGSARATALRRAVMTSFLVLGLVAAVSPTAAGSLGATGATTTALGVMVLMFAGLGALTRSWRWAHLSALGGRRTSWSAVVLAVWLMASQLDIDGGYHDARTLDAPEPVPGRPVISRTLDDALDQWLDAADTDSTCLTPDGRLPMVLVAAPGGGARAMYWTVAGMDELFTGPDRHFCPSSLFAASGVSGGAVGLTTKLSAPPDDEALGVAVDMSAEAPLAATIAALVLRDLPQPFTGIRSGWEDRARVLEEQWPDDGLTRFEEVGHGWWSDAEGPVLLLNGTSVTDGCRVIIGNINGTSPTRTGCLDAPDSESHGRRDPSVFSATTEAMNRLGPGTGRDSPRAGQPVAGACNGAAPQTLYAHTAALLAARFPYVTPSGALRTCSAPGVTGERYVASTSYVVDGGYLENTGLLSLTQAWLAVADRVESCNRIAVQLGAVRQPESSVLSVDYEAGRCPRMLGGTPVLVEPWLVVLENHYGTADPPRRATRVKELVVPPATAFGKRSVTLSTTALEQAAAAAITRDIGGTGACNRLIRLSPGSRPGVEAPLGWVLSEASQRSLTAGLVESLVAAFPTVRPGHAASSPYAGRACTS